MVLISDGEWIAQPVDYRNAERRIGVGYYDYSYDYVVTIYATEMSAFGNFSFNFFTFWILPKTLGIPWFTLRLKCIYILTTLLVKEAMQCPWSNPPYCIDTFISSVCRGIEVLCRGIEVLCRGCMNSSKKLAPWPLRCFLSGYSLSPWRISRQFKAALLYLPEWPHCQRASFILLRTNHSLLLWLPKLRFCVAIISSYDFLWLRFLSI